MQAIKSFYPPPRNGRDRGPSTAERLRRYVAEASELGQRACKKALDDAGIESGAITHLVTVSCTGLASPGLDTELIGRLDLPPDIGRLNLGFMGCHGAFNGLRAAQAFAESEPDACVLLCCVELCSLHFQYGWDMENVVANALFADGAGAAVIQAGGLRGPHLSGTASRVLAGSHDAMSWHVGDHGFEMGLARELPDLIRGSLADWLKQCLSPRERDLDDIAHWAIHPGGPKIIQAVLESLELPRAAGADSEAILAAHGNMSSATILFILQRMRAQAAQGPCIALGFGPGLAFEAAFVDFPHKA